MVVAAQISKYHLVEPDGALCGRMTDMNLPVEYIAVALQLGNNDLAQAKEATRRMMDLSERLRKVSVQRPIPPASPLHVKLERTSLGIARSGEKARRAIMQLSKGDLAVELFPVEMSEERKSDRKKSHKRDRTADRRRRTVTDQDSDGSYSSANSSEPIPSKPAPSTGVYAVSTSSNGSSAGTSANTAATPAGAPSDSDDMSCAICKDSSYTKRDQLVPCTQCRLLYHTQCFGARRIPFTIKCVKDRTNRNKYLAKNYANWLCPRCQPPTVAAETSSAPSSGSGTCTDTTMDAHVPPGESNSHTAVSVTGSSQDSLPPSDSATLPLRHGVSAGTGPGVAGGGGLGDRGCSCSGMDTFFPTIGESGLPAVQGRSRYYL